MRDFTEDGLTEAALQRLSQCEDPRLKAVLVSLVHHLHSFVRQVRPTEAEWVQAIEFLTATGQKCNGDRQEFILLSDTLGVSMLVDVINHPHRDGVTDSTVLGPFFVADAPAVPLGGDISGGVAGTPLYCTGRVLSSAGAPVAGATVDVWQSDDGGHYDVQDSNRKGYNLRGRQATDAAGRYAFWTIAPASYPIPTDGPVGGLLGAVGRHPYRPAHVHFRIEAPGHERLITQVFVDGDPYLDSDVVFGVKDSLVKRLQRRPAGAGPDGRAVPREHLVMTYDFGLARAGS
jgi:hydroxyquinol 1,2-dioxygenase